MTAGKPWGTLVLFLFVCSTSCLPSGSQPDADGDPDTSFESSDADHHEASPGDSVEPKVECEPSTTWCDGDELWACDEYGEAVSWHCPSISGGTCFVGVRTGEAACSGIGGGPVREAIPRPDIEGFLRYPLANQLPVQNAWEYSCQSSTTHYSTDWGTYNSIDARINQCAGPLGPDWLGVPVLSPCDGLAARFEGENGLGKYVIVRCDETAANDALEGAPVFSFFVILIHLSSTSEGLTHLDKADRSSCASGRVCDDNWVRVRAGDPVGNVGATGGQPFNHLHMTLGLAPSAQDLFPLVTGNVAFKVDPYDLRVTQAETCATTSGPQTRYPDGVGATTYRLCGPRALWTSCPLRIPPKSNMGDFAVTRCVDGQLQQCTLDTSGVHWQVVESCACDAYGAACARSPCSGVGAPEDPADAIYQVAFEHAWDRWDGQIGCPRSSAHRVRGVLLQDFEEPEAEFQFPGTDGQTALVHNASQDRAYLLRAGFWGAYKCIEYLGAPNGGALLLGAPTDEEHFCSGFVRQDFERGFMWWDPDDEELHVHPHEHVDELDFPSTSACVGTTVLENPPGPAVAPPDAPVLIAPTDGAVFTTAGDVEFQWASSPGANRYWLAICEDPTLSTGCDVFDLAAGIQSQIIPAYLFEIGTRYWAVRAIGTDESVGWGAYAPVRSFDMATSVVVPGPPTGLLATYDSVNYRNHVTWNGSSGANSYTVFWKVDPGVTTSSQQMPNTTTTDYGHSGVVAGTEYCYRVRANNSAGSSDLSSEDCVTVPVPPPPPTNLSVTYDSGGASNYLTWSASAGASSYTVFWKVGPGVTTSSSTLTPTSTTDYGHSGVVAGTEYCYRVRASNSWGNSGLSSEVCRTVAVNPQYLADGEQCLDETLGWCMCEQPEIHLALWGCCGEQTPWPAVPVSASSDLVGWIESVGETSSDPSDVEVDALATFIVRSGTVISEQGTGAANELSGAQNLDRWDHHCISDYPLPNPTLDTAGFDTLDPNVVIHPFAKPLDMSPYQEGDALVSVLLVSNQTPSTCSRAGLDEHRTDSACNDGICERGTASWLCGTSGYSAASNIPVESCSEPSFEAMVDGIPVVVDICARSVTPVATPQPPSGVTATWDPANNWIYIDWNGSSGASSYTVFWKVDPGVTTSSQQMPNTTTTDYGHNGVVAGTEYCYRVRANNAVGSSNLSSEDCVTVPAPPPPPTNLSVTYDSGNAWDYLTWSASAGASSYTVFWKVGPGVTTSSSTLTPTSTTDYGHSGVVAGTEYCYRVRASNSWGNSGLSSERCVTVLGSPATPTGVDAVYQSGPLWNYVSWNAVSGAMSYTVFWKVGPGVTTSSQQMPNTTTTDYGHSGVVSGYQYCYRVRANNSYGSSSLSVERCASVP